MFATDNSKKNFPMLSVSQVFIFFSVIFDILWFYFIRNIFGIQWPEKFSIENAKMLREKSWNSRQRKKDINKDWNVSGIVFPMMRSGLNTGPFLCNGKKKKETKNREGKHWKLFEMVLDKFNLWFDLNLRATIECHHNYFKQQIKTYQLMLSGVLFSFQIFGLYFEKFLFERKNREYNIKIVQWPQFLAICSVIGNGIKIDHAFTLKFNQ